MRNERESETNPIQTFLDTCKGYTYGFPSDRENGRLSCRGFVRLAYEKLLGKSLPDRYYSKEIFECVDGVVVPVDLDVQPKPFDIYCLGFPRITDPLKIHVAIYLGQDRDGKPIIHDFNRQSGGYAENPLSDHLELFGYEFYGIR